MVWYFVNLDAFIEKFPLSKLDTWCHCRKQGCQLFSQYWYIS